MLLKLILVATMVLLPSSGTRCQAQSATTVDVALTVPANVCYDGDIPGDTVYICMYVRTVGPCGSGSHPAPIDNQIPAGIPRCTPNMGDNDEEYVLSGSIQPPESRRRPDRFYFRYIWWLASNPECTSTVYIQTGPTASVLKNMATNAWPVLGSNNDRFAVEFANDLEEWPFTFMTSSTSTTTTATTVTIAPTTTTTTTATTITDPCTDKDCGHGSCTDGKCVCTAGWDGADCQNNINDCTNAVDCGNGSCNDGVNTFSCACTAGWDGANCKNNINDCTNAVDCGNGSCKDGVNTFSCACTAGWDGADCKNNINDCTNAVDCGNGSCKDGVNTFSCDCTTGWGGAKCNVAGACTVGANGQPCLHSGSATGVTDKCACNCVNGHTGANCEVAPTTTKQITTTTTTAAAISAPVPAATTRTVTTITTTIRTVTTTTTITTTIYEPGNVDCQESQDDCTAACQTSANRNYNVAVQPQQQGRACAGPTDCQPGEGACPTKSTSTTTTAMTTTKTTTTSARAIKKTTASTAGVDTTLYAAETSTDVESQSSTVATRARVATTDAPPSGPSSNATSSNHDDSLLTSEPTSPGGAGRIVAVLVIIILLLLVAAVSLWWFKFRPQQARRAVLGAPGSPVAVQNPTFAPSSASRDSRESVVVVGSNQQSYVVPMMVQGVEDERGEGNKAAAEGGTVAIGSRTNTNVVRTGRPSEDSDYLVPSTAQAYAYELRQVPGAGDHRSNAHIYSPPEPPPQTGAIAGGTSGAGGGGADYTYIDEDAIDDDGHSQAAIEYATVVDGAQLDKDGYVEGGELPSGPAVYAEPLAGGAAANRVVLDEGGYVAGSVLPGSFVYETANSTA